MTLLEIVQRFCERTGLGSPSFVIGSTDSQIIQIKGLVDEVLEDMCSRWTWQDLTEEAHFTTNGVEDQGLVTSIATVGYSRILNNTIYNRTLRLPIYGPMTASQWQALKALPTTGPFYKYRIRGGKLLFNPTSANGHQCYFEYASTACVLAADASTRKSSPTVDSDTIMFDGPLVVAGLRWKWKSEKGLDYAEELARYEALVNTANGRDATKPELSMSGEGAEWRPGILVPPGNWNIS